MSEHETNASSGSRCPRCGAELPANLPPDLCPRCLLRQGLPTQTEPPPTEKMAALPRRSRGLPQPGEQLGHYRIARLLGEGGMGAVFEAEDLESGRRVALKILGESLDSPEARERFFREGRLAGSINHPNSLYVFGTEEIGGTPAIAMELMAGGTLQDRVRERGPLPPGEAVDSMLHIIAGLEAAHAVGILHRDIKPSNCFVDTDGAVKIGDFGLSISTGVRTEPALTASGAFLGTPAFSSPEQLRGDELTVRADMYSVGATLFFLLTGRTPFEAKNTLGLLAAVLEQRPPSPRAFRPSVPEGLAKIVLRCLEKQPGERFQNYLELRAALAPYGSAAPTPATLGLRFLAGAIDQVLIGAAWMSVLVLSGGNAFDYLNLAGKASLKALPIMGMVLAWSILYFTVLEGAWGAAFGKTICGLRVIAPNRNAPGFGRALLRALIYVAAPILPFWIVLGISQMINPIDSTTPQNLMGCASNLVLILLFCTARRRNGFAAVQDLITKTRVISRRALEAWPALRATEPVPPIREGERAVGPYHILETLERTAEAEWLLGYDLRLLRKVWIQIVPPGTPPVLPALRNISRAGRLRWLAGQRSAEANWDAFEAPSGQPLASLAHTRQGWGQVRYWLYDLAREIGAASKDGTLPPMLSLDRVWITADGRAKLFDFPAPGAAVPASRSPFNSVSCGHFLSELAFAALGGDGGPLPLHARRYVEGLVQLPDAAAAAAGLKPLLERASAMTRWRRAAIVGGCIAGPLFVALSFAIGKPMMEEWTRNNPGVMELNTVLQQRAVMNSKWMKNQPHPTDRQFAIYIASHYRPVITNAAVWTGAFTMSLFKGEARQFAEQSVAQNPAPTAEEIRDADAAVKKYLPSSDSNDFSKQPLEPLLMAGMALLLYVCIPALLAALLFRGGLVLRSAGVVFVRKDGARASRLRMFWRALVAWSPLLLPLLLKFWFSLSDATLISLLLVCCCTIVSVALPERGMADRLAGTWPVPR